MKDKKILSYAEFVKTKREFINEKITEDGDHLLFDNEWIQLKKIIKKDAGINGYIYSHEKRCDGKIVAVLPYKKTKNGYQYLLKDEVTPCWNMTKDSISSITGGVEENNPKKTAVHEIKEEAGFDVKQKGLISLGTCQGTKNCDTVYHLFAVDLTGLKQGETVGDGSELEKQASCHWAKNIDKAVDPVLFTLFYKLNKKLLNK